MRKLVVVGAAFVLQQAVPQGLPFFEKSSVSCRIMVIGSLHVLRAEKRRIDFRRFKKGLPPRYKMHYRPAEVYIFRWSAIS